MEFGRGTLIMHFDGYYGDFMCCTMHVLVRGCVNLGAVVGTLLIRDCEG